MIDLKVAMPATEEVEIEEATAAAIDRAIKDADHGHTVSLEGARRMIPTWISKFESRKKL